MLDEADIIGCADYALTCARFEYETAPDVIAIAFALGLRVVPRAGGGCAGMLVIGNDQGVIYASPRGGDVAFAERVAHELGHWAMRRTGVRGIHDERDATAIGRLIQVPRGLVRIECRVRGLGIWDLVPIFPLVRPGVVVETAARILGVEVPTQVVSRTYAA